MIICMDANARHGMWDNDCASMKPHSKTRNMGLRLVEIILKHNLFVHNSGESTYFSGEQPLILHYQLEYVKKTKIVGKY